MTDLLRCSGCALSVLWLCFAAVCGFLIAWLGRSRLGPEAARAGPWDRKDLHIALLSRGRERWIFLYTDETAPDVLRTAGRWAADPELDFTWNQAAMIAEKVARRTGAGEL